MKSQGSTNVRRNSIQMDAHTCAYRLIFLGVLCAALSACDSKAKPMGQSLASINNTEITVHQLNAELAQLGNTQQATSHKDVLDALIARELLVEQAKKGKLDRDPNVMQAIERAKDQILAQAYLKTKLSQAGKPTDAEIEDFYQKNPQLFSQRKQFGTRELAIDTRDLQPELVALMGSAQTLKQVQQWLDAHQMSYVPTEAVRSSVELPAAVVKALAVMKPGQLFTIKQGDRSQLIELQAINDSPLTLAMAREKIEQYLALQKSQQIADAEVARLRSGAKIAYLNQADKPDQTAQASESAAIAATDKKAEPGLSTLERGVANLK